MSDHTTADDASRYRSKEEMEAWRQRDPILRLKLFMEKKGLWTEQYQKEVEEKSKTLAGDTIKVAESAGPPNPRDMFTYTNGTLSQRQLRQMEGF